jgi:hypothetical protein
MVSDITLVFDEGTPTWVERQERWSTMPFVILRIRPMGGAA